MIELYDLASLVVLGCALAGLVMLTAIGSHRRCSLGVSVICGTVFPATWMVWYWIDERPYSRRS